MEIEKKLSVLKKIAEILNQNKITWAVGASLLLYLKGIVTDFQDIDIMVDEKDIPTVKRLLGEVGSPQRKSPNAQYRTKEFLEYVIDGVDLDIMAGFTIVTDHCQHYFPLTQESIQAYTTLDGIPIPLQSVAEWKTYYTLMGRTERVRLIEQKAKEGSLDTIL